MLKRSWMVFVVMAVLSASALAFADGPGASDPQGGSPALIRATAPVRLLATPQLSAPLVTSAPCPSTRPCAVPENWGVSDWLGFFVLTVLTFGFLSRLRVLRPFFG